MLVVPPESEEGIPGGWRIGKVVPPHIITPVRPLLRSRKEKEKEMQSCFKTDPGNDCFQNGKNEAGVVGDRVFFVQKIIFTILKKDPTQGFLQKAPRPEKGKAQFVASGPLMQLSNIDKAINAK